MERSEEFSFPLPKRNISDVDCDSTSDVASFSVYCNGPLQVLVMYPFLVLTTDANATPTHGDSKGLLYYNNMEKRYMNPRCTCLLLACTWERVACVRQPDATRTSAKRQG
jgi:hypothetical protein